MHTSTLTDGKANCKRQPKPTTRDQTRTCSAWGRSSLCSLTGQALPMTSAQGEQTLQHPQHTQDNTDCSSRDTGTPGLLHSRSRTTQEQGLSSGLLQMQHHESRQLYISNKGLSETKKWMSQSGPSFYVAYLPQKWEKYPNLRGPWGFLLCCTKHLLMTAFAWPPAIQSTFHLEHKNSNLRSIFSYLGNFVFFQISYVSN